MLLLAGVLLTGFSLRPAVTSIGALLPVLRDALPLSPTGAGLLTALPTLCFAGLGLMAPRVARRAGPERTVGVAMLLLAVGLGLRAVAGGPIGFLAGSALALIGVAAANVLGPPLVTRWFPDRAGRVTGLYAMSIVAGVALPAAVSVPLADLAGGAAAGGWRVGVGVWGPVAVLAALPWLVHGTGRDGVPAEPADGPTGGPGRVVVLALTAFFGLQSLGAFVAMGWLPAIYVEAGLPGEQAGLLLALTATLAVPGAMVIPVLADRPRARPLLVLAVSASAATGWIGLLVAPAAAPWLWAALLAALHCAYPLVIALVRVRAGGASAELRLSGIVQTGGYALAALGPLATGVLRGATAGWTAPLLAVLALLGLQTVAGLVAAGRPGRRPG